MCERLSWLLIDLQTNNTQDGPFLNKYASPFWPQKLSKTVSIKGEGLLLAFHPSLFSKLAINGADLWCLKNKCNHLFPCRGAAFDPSPAFQSRVD